MSEPEMHPPASELSAFSLGQLPPEAARKIEEHISGCEPCCETMLNLSSDDTFVHLLQEAQQRGTHPEAQRELTEADIPAPLATHPRYQIEELIGHGGMGQVFKARHRMMDRAVALKVINREWVRKQEVVDRFHREVKAAASLTHPNIVTAFDAEQAGDLHFLVMEFVDGIDLAQTVNTRGPLTVVEACDYICQAAEGLQHAHDCGMVHRDIKPHNLMVTKENVVKILDFGLASLVRQSTPDEAISEDAGGNLTIAGAIMGTPDFISPEQAQDASQVDGRSDIYSLGMTLYYLLAGREPFTDGSAMTKLKLHAESEPAPLDTLRDDLSPDLLSVVSRMIAKNPDERFQSPREVVNSLRPFASGAGERSMPQHISPNFTATETSIGAGDGGHIPGDASPLGDGNSRSRIWWVWIGCLVAGLAMARLIWPLGLVELIILGFIGLFASTIFEWWASTWQSTRSIAGQLSTDNEWLKYLGKLLGLIAFIPVAFLVYELLFWDDAAAVETQNLWYYFWAAFGFSTLAGLAHGAYTVKTFYPEAPFRAVIAFTIIAIVVTTGFGFYLSSNEPRMVVAGGAGVDGDGWYLTSGSSYLKEDEPAVLFGTYEEPDGDRGFTYVVLVRHDARDPNQMSSAADASLVFDGEKASIKDGITFDGKGIDLDVELAVDERQVKSAKFSIDGSPIDAFLGNLFLLDLTSDRAKWKQVRIEFPSDLPAPRSLVKDTTLVSELAQRLIKRLAKENDAVREFLTDGITDSNQQEDVVGRP